MDSTYIRSGPFWVCSYHCLVTPLLWLVKSWKPKSKFFMGFNVKLHERKKAWTSFFLIKKRLLSAKGPERGISLKISSKEVFFLTFAVLSDFKGRYILYCDYVNYVKRYTMHPKVFLGLITLYLPLHLLKRFIYLNILERVARMSL